MDNIDWGACIAALLLCAVIVGDQLVQIQIKRDIARARAEEVGNEAA